MARAPGTDRRGSVPKESGAVPGVHSMILPERSDVVVDCDVCANAAEAVIYQDNLCYGGTDAGGNFHQN